MLFEIGKHRVRHGSMQTLREEMVLPPVDFVYSDPPWGDGNLKYWQTINERMTGAARQETDLEKFLTALFDLIAVSCKRDGMVFIEYGLRWEDEIRREAGRIGLHILARSTPHYSGGKRCLLLTMAFVPRLIPDGYEERVSALTGMACVHAATGVFFEAAGSQRAAQSVLDPCCGLGNTARLAVHHGMTFYGNELNLSRLEKTMAVLHKDKQR